MRKKIYRSKTDKQLVGVCAGIADYFNIDPTLIRLAWVILALICGSGVIAYIIAAIMIPEEPKEQQITNIAEKSNKQNRMKKNLWDYFTLYEKVWFFSILIIAFIFAFLFPEEDVNGVNGTLIMGLYLLDTFLNILCELLISKQSKWNFIVSIFVELAEIAICVVLSYRFATMASTLFFWLPIDIISFINWHRHPDRQEEELTEVRKLSGLLEVLVIVAIVIWTVVVGGFLSDLNLVTDLFGGNRTLEVIVCYLDACASAVGIANGVFILLRYREQWIAWYICSLLEAAINIISGQYVLLVLKVGYLTNTTYGYIKWSKYIKKAQIEKQ